ncbi:acyl-CoA thioesterase [Moraxella atlantae]|uniref:Acyl-ACP thioesterase n=1 Tax=Faucicola atlantae TaxID=34059 RepID=A0A378Q0V1_9GAMM|nr:thioesterase family protein [Moraxella atlantae]OPH36549.1 hypothetical protein B5J92_02900 [Moraxella atlantae]STY94440.1 Acyl-ACP thioesterase [Moraxella atlantae]
MTTHHTIPDQTLSAQTLSHPALQDYDVIYPQIVDWGDMDAFNHVNNVVYYDYAQRARVYLLQLLGMFNQYNTTVVVASSCRFVRPVVFPDTLAIGIRITHIGTTSMTYSYHYVSQVQQEVVATAESVLVFVDRNGQKRPISDDERRDLMKYYQAPSHA